MAYTTINKPTDYFDTKVYTGNGSSQTLSMDNLGLLWMKNRTETSSHRLFDSVRGGYYNSSDTPSSKLLTTDNTNAAYGSDVTSAYGINFGSASSTIGSDGGGYNYNQNGKSYVGWQWRANGSGSSNTTGSTNCTVSANTASGFSIVKWTGTGSSATLGHGLGVAPDMIIVKALETSENWAVYHKSLGATKYIELNLTAGEATSGIMWNNTEPTSTLFTVNTNGGVNTNGNDYIAYCFADKQGYSKFSSYTGNGSTDGTFVYTGFKPAWIMIKNITSGSYKSWSIFDNTRQTFNVNAGKTLYANQSYPEGRRGQGDSSTTVPGIDMLSNGFKCRVLNDEVNNTNDFIYMAFAEAPLVGTNNVPCTAK